MIYFIKKRVSAILGDISNGSVAYDNDVYYHKLFSTFILTNTMSDLIKVIIQSYIFSENIKILRFTVDIDLICRFEGQQ